MNLLKRRKKKFYLYKKDIGFQSMPLCYELFISKTLQ